MNGVPDYYEYTVQQTSGGIWYCNRLHVADLSMKDAQRKLDQAISLVEEVLEAHNAEKQKK